MVLRLSQRIVFVFMPSATAKHSLGDNFVTQGGLQVHAIEQVVDFDLALDPIFDNIDSHKGAIFSSGFDYPGRHSRWDIGFIDPALEFTAKGSEFCISALNEQGCALLETLEAPLKCVNQLDHLVVAADRIVGTISRPTEFFAEEDRSRQPSIFSVLRALQRHFAADAPSCKHFGFYGAFGYDLLFQFEDIQLRLNRDAKDKDCHLYLPLSLRIVDRKKERAVELCFDISTPKGPTSELDAAGTSNPVVIDQGHATGVHQQTTCDHAPGEFARKVAQVIDGTKRGDYFEVVLSQTFSTSFEEPPTALFKRLARINPSPYLFLINLGSEQLLGSSPEIFLRVSGSRVETCPIAGTIRRGSSAIEDADRVLALLNSKKDDSELTMCTDVDRNDLARVCRPGTVKIIGRRQVELYSHLIHTVDHLEGELDPRYDSLDAFQTHMWACTVTGAPKPAAVQEIENLETSPRGWYSGAVGMLCFNGDLNTGITLRTATLHNGVASIRAGATLLYGSVPEEEELETRTKAEAFLVALTQGRQSKQAEGNTFTPLRASRARRILLVDYRDSFVHNLAAYFRELGAEVETVRPDFPREIIRSRRYDLVVLSPGPFSPSHFGIPEFVRTLAESRVPIFGVCLGHQGIGEAFGARLGVLPTPVHGKSAVVEHNGCSIFTGIEQHLQVGRYHSLFIVEESLPESLEVLARCAHPEPGVEPLGVIMAIKHRTLPIAGVQFHPESLMTLRKQAGHKLLYNVLELLMP